MKHVFFVVAALLSFCLNAQGVDVSEEFVDRFRHRSGVIQFDTSNIKFLNKKSYQYVQGKHASDVSGCGYAEVFHAGPNTIAPGTMVTRVDYLSDPENCEKIVEVGVVLREHY